MQTGRYIFLINETNHLDCVEIIENPTYKPLGPGEYKCTAILNLYMNKENKCMWAGCGSGARPEGEWKPIKNNAPQPSLKGFFNYIF